MVVSVKSPSFEVRFKLYNNNENAIEITSFRALRFDPSNDPSVKTLVCKSLSRIFSRIDKPSNDRYCDLEIGKSDVNNDTKVI